MGRYYRRRNNNNEIIELLFKGIIYLIALPIFIIIWFIKLSNNQKVRNDNEQKIIYNEKGKKYNFIKYAFIIINIILLGLFIYFTYGLKLDGYICPITLILWICSIIVIVIFDKLSKKETITKNEQENTINNKYINKNINNNENISESKYHIKAKSITDNEKYFLDIIKKHFGKDYEIRPQVPLASIIEKDKDFEKQYQSELNRIIDIGIFDKESSYPLLLIEINDSTHHRKDRQVRDAKVKNICDQAGIKLIAFWTEYSNTEEYVFNRVNENLGR